jgi:hypothetical protein
MPVIKEQIEKGLYQDNLREMIEYCKDHFEE